MVRSRPVCTAASDQDQRHREHRRLVFSLDLDLVVGPQQQVLWTSFLDRQQRDSIAYPRAGLDRRDEAHALEPIVEGLLDPRGANEDLERRRGNQGQTQIAVRDGSAVGTFAARPFDIDVKPLVVARARREPVDTFLVDRDPFGYAELATHKRRAVLEAERWRCQHDHVTTAGRGLRPARDGPRGSSQSWSARRDSRGIARATASCRVYRRWSWAAPTRIRPDRGPRSAISRPCSRNPARPP